MEQTERRSRGFKEAADTSPLVTVVDGPEGGWMNDKAMSAVMDYFSAHPEANAVYEHCVMSTGVIEGLRQIGRLFERGHPDHVYVLAGCAQAPALQLIRDGYVDGLTDVDSWGLIDPNIKAALNYTCLGQPVPKKIDVPVAFYTIENVDTPRWGAPHVWGDMVREVPDFDDWPLLDSGLIETPTADKKMPGY
jgi:ABC-type sugar transport system substrate-binding protein